jgi:hypothetical protein
MQTAIFSPFDLRRLRHESLCELQPREGEGKKNAERDAKWKESQTFGAFANAGKMNIALWGNGSAAVVEGHSFWGLLVELRALGRILNSASVIFKKI